MLKTLADVGTVAGKERFEVTRLSKKVREAQQRDVGTQTGLDEQEVMTSGNGHNGDALNVVWEYITTTSTFQPHSIGEMHGIEADLIETKVKLRKSEERNEILELQVREFSSERCALEARAMSDETAVASLMNFANSETIPVDQLAEHLRKTDEWLSLMLLAQAGLVKYMGSYMYLTDRGSDILDLFVGDDKAS